MILCFHRPCSKKNESPTFSQTVADAGVPGQQGVSTAEAQDEGVCQTEDGEAVGDPVVPQPRLHATDALKKQSKSRLADTDTRSVC